MCGIVCSFGKDSLNFVVEGLQLLSSRGKDGWGVVTQKHTIYGNSIDELNFFNEECEGFVLGHLLHAMENNVKQPLYGKGYFVFNGEIYNWRELCKQYSITARNDSELLFYLLEDCSLDELSIRNILNQCDGPFAFVYFRDSKIILARDCFGVKPLFYEINESKICISSEKKLLDNGVVVYPNELVFIDSKNHTSNSYQKQLELSPLTSLSYEQAEKHLWELLKESVRKRVPNNKKLGVLFSGGIDSTVLVLILKELGIDFICYSAEIIGGNIEESSDLKYAKELAELYDLNLNVATFTVDALEKKTIEVMKIIEDCDYIKTSVALPFHLCAEKAFEDGCSALFSGIGSEELFAGYRRHRHVKDVRLECLKGLHILHERDLYRDDVVTMASSLELRVPFLDKELVSFALSLPASYMLNEDKSISKLLLRTASKRFLELDDRYAFRSKKAAQYGSKFDKGLLRLAKNKNMLKQDYLEWLWDTSINKSRPEKIWY